VPRPSRAPLTVLAALALTLALPLLGTAKLSSREKAERLRALPEEDRRWITEFVAPIVLPEEEALYLDLTEGYQREFFREDFWARRERVGLPAPLGPGYRDRFAELRRRADEAYDGWHSDAGRMVLRWGEPDEVLVPSCGADDVFRELEVWTYASGGSAGRGPVRYIFYRPQFRAPRRLWPLADGEAAVFKTSSCGYTRLSQLAADCGRGGKCNACPDRCKVFEAYEEIRARQGTGMGGAIETARLFQPAVVSTEDLAGQRDRWAASAKPGARPIAVEGPATPAPTRTATSARTPAGITPTPSPPPLSAEEVEARIRALAPRYREWLEIARPLMSAADLARFVQATDAGRDAFMREFWKDRS
jgi:GWxTD domain-containing protein